jgi:hypothetical protein
MEWLDLANAYLALFGGLLHLVEHAPVVPDHHPWASAQGHDIAQPA